MGAIIRTAECAGVDGIIIPEHRSTGLTETVSTVAAGALEHMKVARVVNLARTMEELKERGIWLVGAEGGGRVSLARLRLHPSRRRRPRLGGQGAPAPRPETVRHGPLHTPVRPDHLAQCVRRRSHLPVRGGPAEAQGLMGRPPGGGRHHKDRKVLMGLTLFRPNL